jgi:hypothetical protein
VNGVDADGLTAKMIDNSVVDQLIQENSFRSNSETNYAEDVEVIGIHGGEAL